MEHLLGLASECRRLINRRYKTFVRTLHCALENGTDLYVNEHQKIPHYRVRSTEERRRRMPNCNFYFARCVRKLLYYSDVTHSFDLKSAIEHNGDVKMRDSVRSVIYSIVCNVLCQWSISLIPTYRVYRLYYIPYFRLFMR